MALGIQFEQEETRIQKCPDKIFPSDTQRLKDFAIQRAQANAQGQAVAQPTESSLIVGEGDQIPDSYVDHTAEASPYKKLVSEWARNNQDNAGMQKAKIEAFQKECNVDAEFA